ncbi:MAG: imidazolonepropionase [Candidatus Zixiibacteriota bacterium]|nr:MAG: imidazolonepropionase [candidate division Zixibacteria bacterium]
MPPDKKTTLLIRNVGQLVTMEGPVPRLGDQMKDIGLVEDGAVAVAGEEILAVGKSDEVEGHVDLAEGCRVVDAHKSVITPGLIDPHTHPVFSRTRENEFEMRILGKSYTEIAASGGGIRASVRDLRETSREQLVKKTTERLNKMLSFGITTIEAKSGYGLSTESEIKSLEIIRDLNEAHVIDMVPTFLGAHEIPDEYRDKRREYIDLLINEMIPRVASEKLAEFCDIFCEEGVFNIEESRSIMSAAGKHGLKSKFHADELASTGGAELAAEMDAVSADHLVFISDDGIRAMAKAETAAVLLPGTCFSLGSGRYAPARKMIDSGVIVALSTDCNPGSSFTESLPLMVTLAALHYKMTAAESLSAVTVNAACAIDRGRQIGLLAAGLPADMVIWDMGDYRELPYHYGVNLVRAVIKRGKVVIE